ncbi:Ribonuclease H-like superfamily [Sesbania bispinosa]|nr:Ribonuclease H-like superfamily [Sesbania bispinosa]
MEGIFNFQAWDHPQKYLGLPAEFARSKSSTLSWIFDRLKQKVEGWKENLLNYAGKEVLIKAVLQALPAYAMSVFRFPKGFCKKLSSLVARFWWQGSKGDRGIHWRAWQIITRSKREGGLGFRDFQALNIAHLAKQASRILSNPNSLWAKVLKGIYHPNQDFLNAKKGRRPSWVWASIIDGRDFMRRNGRWSIANGEDISITRDRWLNSGDLVPTTHGAEEGKLDSLINLPNRSWNLTRIRDSLPPDLAIKAVQTPISWFNERDRLYWPYSKDGVLTVRTAYHVANGEFNSHQLQQSSSYTPDPDIWKTIWKLAVPQKIKLFMWRACQNALPVKANLVRRRISNDSVCPVCGNSDETVEHSLLLCNWVSPVWFASQFQWDTRNHGVTRFDKWFSERIQLLKLDSQSFIYNVSLLSVTLWNIWKQRNYSIYRNHVPQPVLVLTQSTDLMQEFYRANFSVPTNSATGPEAYPSAIHWKAPPSGIIKCNVDAAWRGISSPGAVSVVVRDASGVLLTGSTRMVPAPSALSAEALALRDAAMLAYNCNWDRVVLESDNLTLIEACRKERSLGEVHQILDDIFTITARFTHCGFTWTRRSGNEVAHFLATNRLQGSLPINWVSSPPPRLCELLSNDRAFGLRASATLVPL